MESRYCRALERHPLSGCRASASPRRDQRSLMDAVYAAGSLPIAAHDRATKAMATRLTIFGFVVIDEMQARRHGSPPSALGGHSRLDVASMARLEAFEPLCVDGRLPAIAIADLFVAQA